MADPLIALGVAAALVVVSLVLLRPHRGLYWRWQRARQVTDRVLTEDALKHIHKCEMKGRRATLEGVAGSLQITADAAAALVDRMEGLGLLEISGDSFGLNASGREAALHIIRAHRLWESYLAHQTGYDQSEWHGRAEHFEHQLRPSEADALSAQLGNPTHDPHGDPIPDATGRYVAHGGQPMVSLPVDRLARIVHIEDEPEAVYAQLVAEGLYPGMEVRLTQVTSQRIRFWANGDEHVLAPIMAANISVVPVPLVELGERRVGQPLSSLPVGEEGCVVNISPRCRGTERRRLMDLGILPGTVITAELRSPSGDPTAYRIRDALIALRSEQADLININHPAPVEGSQ